MNNFNNHINHSKLEFACDAGLANVNIYTGRVLFERQDITAGAGSYIIGVSHVYDSQPSDITDNYAGNGWKLNVQQYIIKDSAKDKYYYFDEYGYKHEFEKYDEDSGYGKYADATGLGLTLYIKSNDCYILNARGGKLCFRNFSGTWKLSKIVSALNTNVYKVIEYGSDGKIKSVYDGRKSGRKISFTYNENGLLSSLERVEGKKECIIYYAYDGSNNLISVREYENASERYAVLFSYDDGLLQYALSIKNNSGLRIFYDAMGRAASVSDGIMKTELLYSEAAYSLFASNSVICGTDKFCGQKERKFLGYTVSENDDDFIQGDTNSVIGYKNSHTTVKNGKGITYEYYFNEKGFTTGILEKKKNEFKTLFKQKGCLASVPASGYEKINGNAVSTVSGGTYRVPQEGISKLINYLNSDANVNCKDFFLSFWLKLDKNISSKAKIKTVLLNRMQTYNSFTAGTSYEKYITKYFNCSIDKTAKDAWQYVTVPVTADHFSGASESQNISSISIEIGKESYSVADVRLSAGQVPKFTITDFPAKQIVSNGGATASVDEITEIRYTFADGNSGKVSVTDKSFMTESDVIQTYFDLVKNGASKYTLHYNAGTKRIANVKTVELKTADAVFTLSTDTEGGLSYPRYCYCTVPYDKENRIYTFTGYEKRDAIKDSRCCEETHAYPEATSTKNESTEYTWTDFFGRTTKTQDAYGVTLKYEYDEYGNLKKKTLGSVNTKETIEETNEYDSSKETLIETGNSVSGLTAHTAYETNALTGTLRGVTQTALDGLPANTTEYKYNAFNDRIREVTLESEGKIYGRNTLTFDDAGRITGVSPSEGINYGFAYDRFGKATEFKQNGKTLLTKEYRDDLNKVTVKYYLTEETPDTIDTEYDEYGRIKKVYENGKIALKLTYQDETGESAESPAQANVKTMEDYCADKTYTYYYDEYTGQPTEYKVKDNATGKDCFGAKCKGVNKVFYEFDGITLDFEDEIKYDENCLLSPRITEITNNHIAGINWEFGYDELGRIKNKNTQDYSITAVYKAGTALKEDMRFTLKGEFYYDYYYNKITQTYDKRGNVKSVTVSDNRDKSYKSEYSYNAVNQLTGETCLEDGEIKFTREYEYDILGNIKAVRQDGHEEAYEYEQGRLVSVSEDGVITERYGYDNYGNPTHFKSSEQNMTWTRGTYLSKYVKDGKEINYTYDAQGHLVKKNGTQYYYEGDKLLAMDIDGDKKLRFIYDNEGIAGFKLGVFSSDIYLFHKDAQGNVVALIQDRTVRARYIYDAWGNCKIVDKDGAVISDENSMAYVNPIRWKSQLYDTDSGLYWTGERWYDAERGRYISAASPEMLLQNAAVVYALNLYSLCVTNPLAAAFAVYTVLPSIDFYYDGKMSFWERWGAQIIITIVGVVLTAVACAFSGPCGGGATAASVMATLENIAVTTLVGTAVTLAVGGTIAGIQSALNGSGFWEGFAKSVQENLVDALVTSFAFAAVSVAACNAIKHFQCFKEGTLVETEEGLKPIEEIKAGDKVLAYDEQTGEQAYKKVVRLFRNESKNWVKVTINGAKIESTPGHKYYLPETKQWVSAEDLKAGEKVLLFDGSYGIVEAVKRKNYDKPQTTYNFEVEDYHTYYVGVQGVCVHNQNCGFGKYKDGMEMTPDEALDAANDFLGEGYKEASLNRFVSADGVRQIRMSPSDLAIVNNHAGGPHFNFDILKPKYKTIHIYIKGL